MSASPDVIIHDLEIMAAAENYRQWIFDNFRAALGRRVVELGAGIGNFTDLLLDRDLVVAVDNYPPAVAYLERKYAGQGNVIALNRDISNSSLLDLKHYDPDTIVCINVLEHVLDDGAALAHMHGILAKGGQLALLVPAFQFLYGSIDRLIGHHRRYDRHGLQAKLHAAGFRIKTLYFMNCIAVPGWFLNNRILNRQEESAGQVLIFDRFIAPWLKKLERRVHPPFGLSLIAIGEKI